MNKLLIGLSLLISFFILIWALPISPKTKYFYVVYRYQYGMGNIFITCTEGRFDIPIISQRIEKEFTKGEEVILTTIIQVTKNHEVIL